jgi:hypothetical protein
MGTAKGLSQDFTFLWCRQKKRYSCRRRSVRAVWAPAGSRRGSPSRGRLREVNRNTCFGLMSMRERARLLRGNYQSHRGPEEG